MNQAVICKQVMKNYVTGTTTTKALRGVDLTVHEGELLMLVGPSGSGKTTLISVIAGILTQDEGECRIFDTDINHLSSKERTFFRGKEIGFVFQAFNLIPTLTAAENVAIPLLLHGVEMEEATKRAKEILIEVGMEDKIFSLPRELSGGQQQRIAIARSFIHKPRLIVCDEPTSALDHETGAKIMDILRSHALNEKRTIIVVTHDARIFEYADRIVHLEDGAIHSEKCNSHD